MNRFLASVEKRAYRMAKIAVGSREDALDILQETMCKLVEKYNSRNMAEWPALFHTILQSRIRDWYRRESVRNRFRVWFSGRDNEDSDVDQYADHNARGPEQVLQGGQTITALDQAIRQLPLRQQQAFMLRAFEEFDVKETARIMGCSTGSVKTHYSRAVSALRGKLGGVYV